MFIINLTYIEPLETVEIHLQEHIDFLNHYYTEGLFIASGRKNPRTGGIILMKGENKEAVQEIITQDPFYKNKIAQYDIIEFEASKYCPELKTILTNQFNENKEIKNHQNFHVE